MQNFQQIIDQFHPMLYKIGKSYTEDTADFDDLYQEMLIQIWQSLKRFNHKSKISTWIYRVALNTALTHHRQTKKKFLNTELKHIPEPTANSEEHLAQENEQKINLLYESIRALKRDDRAIILLHLEGKQYDEIADIIGISKSNVGVKLLRIRKKLLDLLNQKGYARI